jgi:hypothetical protein
MTAELDLGLFPSAEGLGRAGESRGQAEVVEEAVRVQVAEVLAIPVHGLLERSIEKTDVRERKRMDGDGDFGWDLFEPGALFCWAGGEGKKQAKDAKPGHQRR